MFPRRSEWRSTWGKIACDCKRVQCLLRHGESESDKRPEVGPGKISNADRGRLIKEPQVKIEAKRPVETTRTTTPRNGSESKTPAGEPRLRSAPSYLAISTRQEMVRLFYQEYSRLYADLEDEKEQLAREHALAQEAKVYGESSKWSYKNAALLILARLKKRDKAVERQDAGLDGEVQQRKKKREEREELVLSAPKLEPYLATRQDLEDYGFVLSPPQDPPGRLDSSGEQKKCSRCSNTFIVSAQPDMNACKHHWGKYVLQPVPGTRVKDKVWTCCRVGIDGTGCSSGPHVFQEDSVALLHQRIAFVATPKQADTLEVAALDCEMAMTTAGLMISRVCLMDGTTGQVLLNELVKPPAGVTLLDPNTRFSGVTADDIKGALLVGCQSIRTVLFHWLGQETILIGHGLDNDLKALRIIHHRIVDSAIVYRHSKGPPFRYSLRLLASKLTGQFIQQGQVVESGTGAGIVRASHDAVEDARTALELIQLKTCIMMIPASPTLACSGAIALTAVLDCNRMNHHLDMPDERLTLSSLLSSLQKDEIRRPQMARTALKNKVRLEREYASDDKPIFCPDPDRRHWQVLLPRFQPQADEHRAERALAHERQLDMAIQCIQQRQDELLDFCDAQWSEDEHREASLDHAQTIISAKSSDQINGRFQSDHFTDSFILDHDPAPSRPRISRNHIVILLLVLVWTLVLILALVLGLTR